jgi:uncharacterized protein
MIVIERDIKKIKQLAIKNEDQNYRFRTFLKGKADKKTDSIVHRINKEVESQIDCTQCGNCCITMRPSLTNKEISALSKIENLPRKTFIDTFTEEENFDHKKFLKEIPCKYLANKKCTIYIERPNDCKSFPYIHKSGFSSRTLGMIERYGICPIIYNVFERLKIELRFK